MQRLTESAHRLAQRERGPWTAAFFVQAPLICIAFTVWFVVVSKGWQMQDFMAVRSGAHDVLHGRSPYPPADPSVLLKAHALVYPPLIAYLFVPFALLPYKLAAALYLVLLFASIPAAVWLLGVRDWRCYGVVFLWGPVLASVHVGTIGPLLLLLAAVAWRYRERALIVAPVLATAIALKLFLWPLAFWLVAVRRWRTSAATIALTALAALVPFAPLGYEVLRRYPGLLRALDHVFGPVSFSTAALLEALGATTRAAEIGVAVLAVVLLAVIARLGGSADGDRRAFAAAVAAALLLSPIVWTHYYILLLLPLALARPRLTGWWFLPLLFWTTPALESVGNLRLLLTALAITLAVTAVGVRESKIRATVERPGQARSPGDAARVSTSEDFAPA